MGPNQPVEITEQEEQTTALGKARESKFLPQLLLALTLSTVTPTFTSCSDEPNNPYEQVDKIKPTITILQSPIDITGGKTINIKNGNELYIGDIKAATRDDNSHEDCTYELSLLNGQNKEHIYPGTSLTKSGTIELVVTDKSGNSSYPKYIELTTNQEEPISGLENLKENLDITVDEPVNLLQGINVRDDVKSIDVSITTEGVTTKINNPHNYTFPYPCMFDMTITAKDINGNIIDNHTVNNLTVKPIEYTEATITTANILKDFPFYSALEYQKDQLYERIQIAMNVSGIYEQPTIIMFGEIVEGNNIDTHARRGAENIHDMAPNAELNGFYGTWVDLEKKLDPNKSYIISSALNIIRNDYTKEQFDADPNVKAIKNILNKPNVIIISAAFNKFEGSGGTTYRLALNENVAEDQDCSVRNTSSVNSNSYHNKITVIGENTAHPNNNYFSQTGGVQSLRPVEYNEGNIVMFSTGGVDHASNKEDPTTNSSYPTALLSGIMSSVIPKIKSNHPGITDAGAMGIVRENYLNGKRLKDKKNENIVESNDYGYKINTQKFKSNEMLHIPEIENTEFNKDIIELPSYPGLGYIGKGIMFTYNGTLYESSKNNQSYYENALRRNDTKRFLDVKKFRKEGGGNNTNFSVFAVDKDGEMIPDTRYECTYPISTPKYNSILNYYNYDYITTNTSNNLYNINWNQTKLKP